MFIEQPPFIYRSLFSGALWRIPDNSRDAKTIYLTFDDGPIPQITEWVLDLLDQYNIKATFFCVGDNVRKYPQIYQQILDRGHKTGNHTFNHLQGLKTKTIDYLKNVEKAAELIESELFRPPHGHIKLSQFYKLKKRYQIVLWDVVSRDYSSKQTPEQVFNNVKKYARDGSIIVFHDSIKAEKNMKYALPISIEWLLEQGYVFKTLGNEVVATVEERNLHSSENDIRELVHDYR